jgi:hypothetical protein
MDLWGPFIYAAVFLTLALIAKSFQPRLGVRRALARAPNVAIADIKDGAWVKVSGLVGVVGPQMMSPISGQECVGFWVEVVRSQSRELNRETCSVFSITDDTGIAYVDGPFMLVLDVEDGWSVVPKERYGVLEEAGVQLDAQFFNRFTFREGLLQSGDRVSVLGCAFLEPDPARPAEGFRSPAMVRHLRGSEGKPVVVGDTHRLSRKR